LKVGAGVRGRIMGVDVDVIVFVARISVGEGVALGLDVAVETGLVNVAVAAMEVGDAACTGAHADKNR
jgi:hypothetical protein